MRIAAFITEAVTLRAILAHLGEPLAPTRIAPACGPSLWEAAGAEWLDASPPWDSSAQPEPAYPLGQRIAW